MGSVRTFVPKITFVLWGPFGSRADEIGNELGARRVSMTLLYGRRHYAPIRYFVLFFKTLVLLIFQRPETVYAQNPPVFCPLAALLYCRVTGKRLVIDHHAVWNVKTNLGRASRVIAFLERFVSSRAFANTAPHQIWAEMLSRAGASRVLVIHDFVPKNPWAPDESIRSRYSKTRFLAIASHGGHPLERLEAEAGAVASVEDVTLLVTGPEAKLRRRMEELPEIERVKYLGLLPMEEYMALKASCDLALNITDEPYTLSHVLYEFVASSLPVISSRQRAVEDVFGDSIIYTEDSSPSSIAREIESLVKYPERMEAYKEHSSALMKRLEEERNVEMERLKSLVSS